MSPWTVIVTTPGSDPGRYALLGALVGYRVGWYMYAPSSWRLLLVLVGWCLAHQIEPDPQRR